MPESAVDAINLIEVTKVFRLGVLNRKTAVNRLTLNVPQGQTLGLLGPNGSGKSTTMKMILGFLRPTEGEILLCGQRAEERGARKFIGYLPENPRFQKFLRAREVLLYFGRLLNMSAASLSRRTEALLELVGLAHAANERVQGFSKGMTQRLAIAQALLNQPKILLFDEPMSGLDPLGRLEIRKLILQIRNEMPSATIFFSSHVLADVEAVCSHVALLRHGELASFQTVADLLTGQEQRFEIVARNLGSDAETRFRSQRGAQLTPAGLTLLAHDTEDLVGLLGELSRQGATVVGISSQRQTLEEALFGASAGPALRSEDPPKTEGARVA